MVWKCLFNSTNFGENISNNQTAYQYIFYSRKIASSISKTHVSIKQPVLLEDLPCDIHLTNFFENTYVLAENRRRKNCEIDFASRFIALKSSLTKKEPLESILEDQRYRFVTIPPLLFNSTLLVLSYHSTCQKVGFKANKLAKCYIFSS